MSLLPIVLAFGQISVPLKEIAPGVSIPVISVGTWLAGQPEDRAGLGHLGRPAQPRAQRQRRPAARRRRANRLAQVAALAQLEHQEEREGILRDERRLGRDTKEAHDVWVRQPQDVVRLGEQ